MTLLFVKQFCLGQFNTYYVQLNLLGGLNPLLSLIRGRYLIIFLFLFAHHPSVDSVSYAVLWCIKFEICRVFGITFFYT